jgi:hypothetical protein
VFDTAFLPIFRFVTELLTDSQAHDELEVIIVKIE